MEKLSNFVDMALSPPEAKEEYPAAPEAVQMPTYPYGLSMCLEQEQLDKIGFDEDASVGDLIHGHFMAKITSVSARDTSDGPKRRVEFQIIALAAEDENDENDEADAVRPSKLYSKMYNEG